MRLCKASSHARVWLSMALDLEARPTLTVPSALSLDIPIFFHQLLSQRPLFLQVWQLGLHDTAQLWPGSSIHGGGTPLPGENRR